MKLPRLVATISLLTACLAAGCGRTSLFVEHGGDRLPGDFGHPSGDSAGGDGGGSRGDSYSDGHGDSHADGVGSGDGAGDNGPAPDRLVFKVEPPATGMTDASFTGFQVTLESSTGTPLATSGVSVALTAFTDDACSTTPASGVLSGTPAVTTNGIAGFQAVQYDTAGKIYLRASAAGFVSACSTSIDVASPPVPLAWIGRQLTGGAPAEWATTGTAIAAPTPDYALNQPVGVTADATYLYVADSQNGRVVRFDRVTGTAHGWIGQVGSNSGLAGPDGTGSCPSSVVGTFTGGWCSGGASALGFNSGLGPMVTPTGMANDATYLYVHDRGGFDLLRFVKATGAFAGWVGGVGNVSGLTCPTGTPVVGQVAPSWCTGGVPQTGTSNGMFEQYGYEGIATDGTSIYAAESFSGEVYKFDAASGAFVGWLGKVESASGISCLSGTAVLNQATPSWCTGGMAGNGLGDGMFLANGAGNMFMSVAVAAGHLYVTDGRWGHSRVQMFAADTGAFQGWIGYVTATAGMSCSSGTPAAGQPTPSWCTGGTRAGSDTPGGFRGPAGVYADLPYLYVVDSADGTVQRYTAAGTFAGWKGVVLTQPAGGDPGCDVAPVGTFTPGWCTGGGYDMTQGNTILGQLNVPQYIAGDATYLYVADSQNNRILRLAR